MIATIHQPQYLPWLGYFDKADQADIFIILDNVQFKKNEWQNRNRIKTAQGWQWLTVPVIHDFGQLIKDVKINNNTKWRSDHKKAIQLNYGKSKFYSEYKGFLEDVFDREWEYLNELNIYFIKKIVEILGIETKIITASKFNVTNESTQRLVDLCKEVKARIYLSGVDGGQYMDFEKFRAEKIEIITQEFQHPEYDQLWEKGNGFISHLSIIDLLFNYGKESLSILGQGRGQA